MNNELEKHIVELCPILYQYYHGSEYETLMHWGFECDDGWFVPIFEASKKIEKINRFLKKYNQEIVADQVKEKYGELRFYYHFQERYVFKTIHTKNFPHPSFFNDKLLKPKNMKIYWIKYFYTKVINIIIEVYINAFIEMINDFNSFLHKKDKQKFNELKDLFESEVENIISEAEVRCWERCEICGSKSDVTSTKGWIKRLCGYCMRKRNDKNE